MEIPDDLECLFTAQIEEYEDSYQIQVPTREIELGEIAPGDTYRIAVLRSGTRPNRTKDTDTAVEASDAESSSKSRRHQTNQEPPVEVGDTREVEIDNLGDQGDGIARVERGYVLIIPDTEVGDRVTVRIETTKQNVGFAEVVERHQRPQHD